MITSKTQGFIQGFLQTGKLHFLEELRCTFPAHQHQPWPAGLSAARDLG